MSATRCLELANRLREQSHRRFELSVERIASCDRVEGVTLDLLAKSRDAIAKSHHLIGQHELKGLSH
jgi:hypothetical protein